MARHNFTRVNPPAGTAKEHAPTDVRALLRLNVEHERRAGGYDATPKPENGHGGSGKAAKWRDYIFTLILGNGVFFCLQYFFPSTTELSSIVGKGFAVAGMVSFTAGISWITWKVANDY